MALGNSGPGISVEQIQPIIKQIVRGMLNAGEPGAGELEPLPGPHEGGTPIEPPEPGEGDLTNGGAVNGQESGIVTAARNAIAKGASREAVMQRLQQNGITAQL